MERSAREPGRERGLVACLLEQADGADFAARATDVMPTIKTAIGAGEQEPGDSAAIALLGILGDPLATAQMRADPGGRAQAAVEEAIRWIPPIQQIGRRTTRPVERHGVTVGVGEMVTLSVASANRDERVWGDDADAFRLDRGPGRHLGFGYGMHFCAGNYFGRAVIRLTLQRVFERLVDLRLDDGDEPSIHGMVFRKVTRLPVVWQPGSAA
jgi:cytochrome P450